MGPSTDRSWKSGGTYWYSEPMGHAFIVLNDIGIRNREKLAFLGLHWRINDDECWGLIGAETSGKGLLLRAIQKPQGLVQGKIEYYFDGACLSGTEPRQGEIERISPETQARFFRRYAAYHQARWHSFEGESAPSVAALLATRSLLNISPYETEKPIVDETAYARRRASVIEILGIQHLLSRNILYLSNGETRKLLLAQALIRAPKLLILDEPFEGLDSISREKLIEAINKMVIAGDQKILISVSRRDELPKAVTHLMGITDYHVAIQGEKALVLHSGLARELFLSPSETVAISTLPLIEKWDIPAPGTPLVELRRVNVVYDGVRVLQELDWKMLWGERWAIRGPNGAGKTTLLSLILADNPQAYANDFSLFGRRRGTGESIWDIKKRIGFMSPELNVFYRYDDSCLSVVCSGLYDSIGTYTVIKEDDKREAMLWLESLGLRAIINQAFLSVTLGDQRLVLLARALVKRPQLLILDEPCQGLDAAYRKRLVNAVEALCASVSIGLIYVAHHTEELPRSIKQVLELDNGRVKGKRRL